MIAMRSPVPASQPRLPAHYDPDHLLGGALADKLDMGMELSVFIPIDAGNPSKAMGFASTALRADDSFHPT
jgi:hypothetical protein